MTIMSLPRHNRSGVESFCETKRSRRQYKQRSISFSEESKVGIFCFTTSCSEACFVEKFRANRRDVIRQKSTYTYVLNTSIQKMTRTYFSAKTCVICATEISTHVQQMTSLSLYCTHARRIGTVFNGIRFKDSNLLVKVLGFVCGMSSKGKRARRKQPREFC